MLISPRIRILLIDGPQSTNTLRKLEYVMYIQLRQGELHVYLQAILTGHDGFNHASQLTLTTPILCHRINNKFGQNPLESIYQ